MKFCTLLFLTILFSFICCSQTINWLDINGLQGCTKFQEGIGGKIFAMTQSAIYTSIDDGMNWSQPMLNRGQLLSFVTNKEMAVIHRYITSLTNRSRVELSTDNGETWNVIFQERSVYYTISGFGISDSGYVFAIRLGSSYLINHLMRYNGTSWDTIGNPLVFANSGSNKLVIDHTNDFFYICNSYQQNGLFVSTDYGKSWNRKLEAKNPEIVYVTQNNTIVVSQSMAQLPNGTIIDGAVYTSTDRGTTWQYIGLTDKTIYSFGSDRDDNIYASTNEGIYRYSVGTSQWSYFGPPSDILNSILVISSGTIITSGFNSAIFRTTDMGSFWSPNGPKRLDIFSLMSTPSGKIFAGTLGDRIFSTASGGSGWVQTAPGVVGDYVYSLSLSDADVFACTDDGLFKSTDDGTNWTNLTNNAFGGSVFAVAIPLSKKIIAATNFGIYTSSDSGSNWIPSGLQNSQVLFLTLSKSNIVYAVTDHDSVYSSSDEGTSWINCNLNRNDIQTIVTNDAGDIFVGVYGGVLRSTDGGANWQTFTLTNSYVYSLVVNQLQHIIAGTYNGVYVSRNNGVSWTSAGLNGGTILSLSLDNHQNILAGLYHGGAMRSDRALTGVENEPYEIPTSTQLYQNYPNPFNPSTTIKYSLVKRGEVKIKVYNTLGQLAKEFNEGLQEAGNHEILFDASSIPSGVYFYQIKTSYGFVATKKMLLIK